MNSLDEAGTDLSKVQYKWDFRNLVQYYYRMKEIVKEKELVIVRDGKGLFLSFIFEVLQLDAGNKEVLKLKKFLDGKVKEHKTATAKAMSKMFKK